MHLPRRKKQTLEYALLAVAWLFVTGMIFWHGLVFPLQSPSADYGKHWEASVAILEGRSPYYGEELYLGFNYPMLTGFLFLHLAAFTKETGQTVWEIGNFLFLIGGALVFALGMKPRQEERASPPGDNLVHTVREILGRHWITFTFFFLAAYEPLHRVLIASNMEPLNLLIGSLFTVLFFRGKDTSAGVALAFFALTKLAPILLLIPLVGLRRWRVVAGCLGTLLVYGLFLLVTGYWRTEMALYTDVAPKLGFHYMDLSLSIHRFYTYFCMTDAWQDAHLYSRVTLVINVLLMGLYVPCVFWWSKLNNRDPDLFLAFGMFMVLPFTPLLEINHFVWSVGAVFLQLRAWIDGRLRDELFAALLVFAWAPMLTLFKIGTLHHFLPLGWPGFVYQTFALFSILGVSAFAAYWPKPLKDAEPDTSTKTEPAQA